MGTSITKLERPYSHPFLCEYSREHLTYEVDMLLGLARFLVHPTKIGAQGDDGRIISNIIVEGFGMHLRNVIEFLYSEKPRPIDVVASDFCDSDIWESARPAIPA